MSVEAFSSRIVSRPSRDTARRSIASRSPAAKLSTCPCIGSGSNVGSITPILERIADSSHRSGAERPAGAWLAIRVAVNERRCSRYACALAATSTLTSWRSFVPRRKRSPSTRANSMPRKRKLRAPLNSGWHVTSSL